MGSTVGAHCKADVLRAWTCVPAVLVGLVKICNFLLQPFHLWTLKFSCKRKPQSEDCTCECSTAAGICCVSTGGLCRHSSAGTCRRTDPVGSLPPLLLFHIPSRAEGCWSCPVPTTQGSRLSQSDCWGAPREREQEREMPSLHPS